MTGTAIHEGGHCVGMAHENRYYNMMGADFTHVTWDSGSAYYGPGEDMSNGLIDLHGKKSSTDAYRDVGVTTMRYSGPSGEYSAHEPGVVRDTSGTKLPVVGSFAGQERFQVDAGQSIQVEVTLENNGEKDSESPVLFSLRLSTNDIISSHDPLLKTYPGVMLGRDVPFETTVTATIPSSTTEGEYYLGLVIDDDFAIGEVTGLNNYAYYPLKVVVHPDLIVSSFNRTPGTVRVGGNLDISAIVKNQGTGISGATTLRYYRSSNLVISSGDSQVCSDYVATLSPGDTSHEACTVSVPTTPGTWWYGGCVDAVSGESNTFNNCSGGYQVDVVPASSGAGLAVDFGADGLYSYDGSSWSKLTGWNASNGGLARWGTGKLAVDFHTNGVYSYNGSSWSKLTGWNPGAGGLAGWGSGNVAVDFDTNGVYSYNGSSWTKLTGWNAQAMAGWSGGLAVDFGVAGLWSYDGSSWSKLTGWDAGNGGCAGWAGGLAVDFDTNGLYSYDGSSWSKLTGWNPGAGGLAGWGSGNLAVDFDTNGVYSYNGSSWRKLTGWNPGAGGLAGWGSGNLAVDFDSNGLYSYNGSSWRKLTGWNPEAMDAGEY